MGWNWIRIVGYMTAISLLINIIIDGILSGGMFCIDMTGHGEFLFEIGLMILALVVLMIDLLKR